MNQADATALLAEMMVEWTTITPETAFADQVRWLMTAVEDRDGPSGSIRFGGGLRLSGHRPIYIHEHAARSRVDAVYLTFGKRLENGPSQAFVVLTREGKVICNTCDFWMPEDGRLQLVTRDRRCEHIGIEAGRLTVVGRPLAPEIDTGRKRAKAMLRNLQVTRRGKLRDQLFFEDCSVFAPIRAGLTPGMIAKIDGEQEW